MRAVLSRRGWICLLGIALLTTSCGRQGLQQVKGKVLYRDEPIEGVLVTFHPGNASMYTILPTGQTKADGTFIVTTGTDSGAPPGPYVVTFVCLQQKAGDDKSRGRWAPEDRFKNAYSSEATSQFKVEIHAGTNDLEPFSLK